MSGRIPTLLCALLLLVLAALPAAAEETVCLQCHGGQPGKLGAAVTEWHGSVHQRNGISCHDCHGGDPADYENAMSPERGFLGAPDYDQVPAFCGRCHVGVLADYQESAHGRAVTAGGAQCVICHGNHAVNEASLELINETSCTRCHDYERAATIKSALGETDAKLAAVAGNFERLKRLGVDVKPLHDKHFDLRNRFHRVFHSVEIDKVKAETVSVQEGAAKLQAQVDEYDRTFAERRLWGGVAVGLLVLLGIVLLQVRRTYKEEEEGK